MKRLRRFIFIQIDIIHIFLVVLTLLIKMLAIQAYKITSKLYFFLIFSYIITLAQPTRTNKTHTIPKNMLKIGKIVLNQPFHIFDF